MMIHISQMKNCCCRFGIALLVLVFILIASLAIGCSRPTDNGIEPVNTKAAFTENTATADSTDIPYADTPFTETPTLEPGFITPIPTEYCIETDTPVLETCTPESSTEVPIVDPSLSSIPTETVSAVPSSVPAVTDTPAPTEPANMQCSAVFLGVKNYGHVTAQEVMRPGAKIYRFLIDGNERLLSVRNDSDFTLQNHLMEGYKYTLTVEDDQVTALRLDSSIPTFSPVVSAVPGKRTLKNFIMTALMPLGKTLYVYGGGWDWQDQASSVQSVTIGPSGTWSAFYDMQTADYDYKDENHPEGSYYPFGGWNEYYYAGLDCSGYLGWVLYNTLETESGRSGYVYKSKLLAQTLAYQYGLGTWSDTYYELGAGELRPGDIISMPDHVYICLGRCSDNSIVILHSTVSRSSSGHSGGGVQLSALSPNGSTSSEAYRLANYYQSKYFPDWTNRYPVVMKSFDKYLNFRRTGTTGVFRWSIGAGLSDPDNYASLSAAEILADIFGE